MKFFTQLKTEANKIQLTSREREAMFAALQSEMHGGLAPSPIRVTPSPIAFFSPHLLSSLAFVLILTVIGSGTAYAAEGALPGDVLYPIKVNVNEKIAAAVAVSAEAKAAVHARLAERRMEEAQTLASRGTLTADAKAVLEANFESHATEVETIVSSVEARDPVAAADISARFGSSLEAGSAVLAQLGSETDERGGENSHESIRLAEALKSRGARFAAGSDGARRKAIMAMKAERVSAPQRQAADTLAKLTMMAVSAERPPVEDRDAAVTARINLTASTTIEEAERYLLTLKKLDATTSARTKAQIGKVRDFIKRLRENKNGTSNKQDAERALRDAITVKTFIEAQGKFQDHALLPAPDLDGGEAGSTSAHSETEDVSTPASLPATVPQPRF